MQQLEESLVDLISQTASNMPDDVRRAIKRASDREDASSKAGQALAIIRRNIDMAHESILPICQDTGMPTFEVYCPVGVNQIPVEAAIRRAVEGATRLGRLRPNSVDSITGKNSGNNLGPGTPVIHFHQWEQDEMEVRLLLKGGGCENKNIQYSLPMELLGAGRADRSLEGVYKCLLHAVYQAQGQGCSVGVLGVCVGGDRTSGYQHAKEQLFRSLDDTNSIPELAAIEERVMGVVDQLEIGTMGFGGNVTLLGCKVGVQNRLPASYFVSVAYNCWAYRRLAVRVDIATGAITKWLYRSENPARLGADEGLPVTGREVLLNTPLSDEAVRSLRVGDVVLLSGNIYTGRDELHKYLLTHDSPVDLQGGAIYHCGPVMLKDEDGKWHVKAAGPTTSMREEPYQAEILRKFGVRAVIGKGGMGARTLDALREVGAVYLNAIGGAAQVYAEAVTDVDGVHFLDEFGVPEAMWSLQVDKLYAIVTMDTHGNSLHAQVDQDSLAHLRELAAV